MSICCFVSTKGFGFSVDDMKLFLRGISMDSREWAEVSSTSLAGGPLVENRERENDTFPHLVTEFVKLAGE